MTNNHRGGNGHRRRRHYNRTPVEDRLSPALQARSVTEMPLSQRGAIPRPRTSESVDVPSNVQQGKDCSPQRLAASFAQPLDEGRYSRATRRRSCNDDSARPNRHTAESSARIQRFRPPDLLDLDVSQCEPPTVHLPLYRDTTRQYLRPMSRNGNPKRKHRNLDFAAPVEDMAEALATAAYLIIVESKERRESFGASLTTLPTVLNLTPRFTADGPQLSPSLPSANISFAGRRSISPCNDSALPSPDSSTTRKFDVPPMMELPAANHTLERFSRGKPQLTKRIESDLRELYEGLTKKIQFGDAAPKIFTASLVYLRRISLQGVSDDFAVDERNYKRLCTVAILLATKLYIEAHVKVNIKFSEATGIPLLELNRLEIEFLHLVDFSLLINEVDFETMFDWVEGVAQKKGVVFARPQQSPGSSVTSLSTPLKTRGGGPSTSVFELTPEALSRTNNGNISPCSLNQSFTSPKLFTVKYVTDDASPLTSPKRDRMIRMDSELETRAPSAPSSGDACAFFKPGVGMRPNSLSSDDSEPHRRLPLTDEKLIRYSPPPRLGIDSDSDHRPPPPRLVPCSLNYTLPRECLRDRSAPLFQLHEVDDFEDDQDNDDDHNTSRQQRISRADACPW